MKHVKVLGGRFQRDFFSGGSSNGQTSSGGRFNAPRPSSSVGHLEVNADGR